MISTRFSAVIIFSLLSSLLLAAILETWHSGFNWHDQQRAYQLLILVISSVLFLDVKASPAPRPVFFTITVLLFTGAASSLLAEHPLWAIKEWTRYAGLMIFVLLRNL